jgi:hypothetical protein
LPPSTPKRTAGIGLSLALGALALSGCPGGGGGGQAACAGFVSPATGSGATVTVTGTVAYEDKAQDASGFTGAMPSLPVREAAVEVVRCSDGAVLGSDVSNDAGAFSVDVINTANVGAYVRVLAQIDDPAYSIAVKDTTAAIYAVRGNAFDERFAPPQALQATEAEGIGPPFNILDNALASVRFVEANLGLGGGLASLTLQWQAGVTDFTAYLPSTRTVFILDQPNAACPGGPPGSCADTDGYDDQVIRHEVGHFIADQVSKDDSRGGTHTIGETDQDGRLSWSEGFADFFGGAVAGNPDYVDTFAPVPAGGALTFSMEDLGASTGGSTSELGVAGALWDGLDGFGGGATDTDGDPSVLGPVPILSALADLAAYPDPVEFGAFWNALRADTGNPPADVEDFRTAALAYNDIDLFEDDTTDDDPVTATVLSAPPVTHDANLVWDVAGASAFDLDHYRVTLASGTTYTILTMNLTDGADPYLTVMDDGATTVLAENDNRLGALYTSCDSVLTPACPANGPPELLGSRVFFTPSATATYVIQVARSPVPPPSAGLFGGYRLQITP